MVELVVVELVVVELVVELVVVELVVELVASGSVSVMWQMCRVHGWWMDVFGLGVSFSSPPRDLHTSSSLESSTHSLDINRNVSDDCTSSDVRWQASCIMELKLFCVGHLAQWVEHCVLLIRTQLWSIVPSSSEQMVCTWSEQGF